MVLAIVPAKSWMIARHCRLHRRPTLIIWRQSAAMVCFMRKKLAWRCPAKICRSTLWLLREQFPGRGYLEALGADALVKKQDVVLPAHFVNLTEKKGALYLQKKQRQEAEPEEIDPSIQAIVPFPINFPEWHTLYCPP
jgi:hypothetical protein